jgi:hypothetical protein
MSIGVFLRVFIGCITIIGDVIVRTLFPHFMSDQACSTKINNIMYSCIVVSFDTQYCIFDKSATVLESASSPRSPI